MYNETLRKYGVETTYDWVHIRLYFNLLHCYTLVIVVTETTGELSFIKKTRYFEIPNCFSFNVD